MTLIRGIEQSLNLFYINLLPTTEISNNQEANHKDFNETSNLREDPNDVSGLSHMLNSVVWEEIELAKKDPSRSQNECDPILGLVLRHGVRDLGVP